MSELTREQIKRAASRLKLQKVDTPEWKGEGFVYVRRLPANQAGNVQNLAARILDGSADETQGVVEWCILGACNKRGKALFTHEDIPWLLKGPGAPVRRCALATIELNDIQEAAVRRKKR